MPTRIGINGFGRMGRLVVRALAHHDGLELVHVNETEGDIETAAHLMAFDSVHGRWKRDAGVDGDRLQLGPYRCGFSQAATPGEVPWDDAGVDIVLECTGAFRTMATLEPYFGRSVQKVVVAAPVKDDEVLNVVMGCNDDRYDPLAHRVVTAASCTTNCIAPVVKVLHERIGIERGTITTIHDVTNTQVVVDAPHKDLRRARSALTSLIPTSTGSATAITMIYPELTGRLDGLAVRVPLLNASLSDCVFSLARDVTADEVNEQFMDAAGGELDGILGFESRPLVSVDFVNDARSGVVDGPSITWVEGPSTQVIDGRMVKVLVWYDNEYGYVHRMAELAAKVAASLPTSP